MNYVILAALSLAVLSYLVFKIKDLFFKAKDAKLVKEDTELSRMQKIEVTQVEQAKANISSGNVSLIDPERIQDFWNKDKK